MKKIILTLLAVVMLIGLLPLFTSSKNVPMQPTSYTQNPDLKTILPPSQWPGTPLDEKGLFMNHEFPFVHSLGNVLKWTFEKNPQRAEKKADTFRLEVLKNGNFLSDTNNVIVWFGHASFFVRLQGKTFLIDPIFGKLPVGKRYTEMPIDPQKLVGIDYLLVSHAHYDHCDKESVKQIMKQNPTIKILTGLKLDVLLQEWTQSPNIQAAGWYQQYATEADLKITFVPSRHWANRGMTDANQTLWGGFVLQAGGKTVYFGGDSGYGSHFKKMKDIFPTIDVAMIGVGAYSPRWFMAPNHQDPQDGLRAFHETGAKTLIPMHFGTFDSADEPMSEPHRLMQEFEKEGKIKGKLALLKIGETLDF